MKTEVAKKSDTETTLKISVDKSSLEPYVKQTLDQLRGHVKAAGFRPGKAPDHIVERELGSQTVQSEVLETAVRQSYADAVREHDLPVIAPPDVQVTKFVPYDELEYTATVEVLPKIKLADYKNFKLKRPEVKVEDKEIDEVVEDLRKRLAERKKVDRPAKNGDEVNIDFEGSRNGEPVAGATSKGYDLVLGSKSFIPGFEDELVGLKADSEKEFDIKFPKDYSASELADQTVRFKIKLNTVSEVELPEVNQDFVNKVSPHETVEHLRDDIRQRITDEKTEAAERQFEQMLLDELLKQSQFNVPERLLSQQLTKMRSELGERLESSGLDIDKYLKMTGKTAIQVEEEMRPEAQRRVGLALVLTEAAKAEDIKVTPAEVSAELQRLRQAYNDQQLREELNRPEVEEEIYNHLMASKTIAQLMDYIS